MTEISLDGALQEMADADQLPAEQLVRTEIGARTVSTIRWKTGEEYLGVHCETAVTELGTWKVLEEYDNVSEARQRHDFWVGRVWDGSLRLR